MSFSLTQDAGRQSVVRALSDVRHVMNEAFEEEHKLRGMTKVDIARELGTDKSFVTKKFTGESNLTFVTLALIAHAMDRDVQIRLPSRRTRVGTNLPDLKNIPSTSGDPLPKDNPGIRMYAE